MRRSRAARLAMIVLFDQQPSLRRELQRLRVPTEFHGLALIQMIRHPAPTPIRIHGQTTALCEPERRKPASGNDHAQTESWPSFVAENSSSIFLISGAKALVSRSSRATMPM